MKECKLEVYLQDRHVGTLAAPPGRGHRMIAFAYSDSWLETGFAVSPFSLPTEKKIFIPSGMQFRGLWGVFADSLPDAWGRLLVDRMLRRHGLNPEEVTPLERLAIVGDSGMGALTYRPAWETKGDPVLGDLDRLAEECRAVLNQQEVGDPDELYRLGGSSGGARPKAVTEEWIIKFPASGDMRDTGLMEKEYMDCAASCGITVPGTKLMPSRQCAGYFAVRRFDRDGGERKHMLSAAAILEADRSNVSLDYHTLMKLTSILSRGSTEDLQEMYRRMCFNVFAHNRDDHAGNFSWIYDGARDCWHPSPAYDLTWSTTYYGEHTTTVDGNGRDPGEKELMSVGKKAGLSGTFCRQAAEEIREKTQALEQKYRGIRS